MHSKDDVYLTSKTKKPTKYLLLTFFIIAQSLLLPLFIL